MDWDEVQIVYTDLSLVRGSVADWPSMPNANVQAIRLLRRPTVADPKNRAYVFSGFDFYDLFRLGDGAVVAAQMGPFDVYGLSRRQFLTGDWRTDTFENFHFDADRDLRPETKRGIWTTDENFRTAHAKVYDTPFPNEFS